MKHHWRMSRAGVLCGIWVAMMMGFAGCANILVPKYRVMVDALTDPEHAKPTGKSYRLVGNKTLISQTNAQLPAIVACVNAALTTKGLFDAPAGVPSDVFIDVGFGTGISPRGDPSVREVFLQLSARTNNAKSMENSEEDEIWTVRVAVDGVTGKLEAAMPLLATVAADYLGADTQVEISVDIPKKSPLVESTRQNAVKILQGLNDRPMARSSPEAAAPAQN